MRRSRRRRVARRSGAERHSGAFRKSPPPDPRRRGAPWALLVAELVSAQTTRCCRLPCAWPHRRCADLLLQLPAGSTKDCAEAERLMSARVSRQCAAPIASISDESELDFRHPQPCRSLLEQVQRSRSVPARHERSACATSTASAVSAALAIATLRVRVRAAVASGRRFAATSQRRCRRRARVVRRDARPSVDRGASRRARRSARQSTRANERTSSGRRRAS
jgi:hypothetical protein